MTMQTLVVLLIGACFGWRLGVATISLYLFEGIIGLPVFSGTPENGIGLIYFTGPTMGYLLGFLVAVYISGKFDYNSNLIKNFLKNINDQIKKINFEQAYFRQDIGFDL